MLTALLLGLAAAPQTQLQVPANSPSTASDEWTSDFDAACQEAEATGKDLLLDFTGSDWCFWCHRLHEEVFAQDEFTGALERFLPVTLDFPSAVANQDADLRDQNEALKKRFDVSSFPTVYLCDGQGRPYARTGYREGGAAPYVEHLDDLRRVRELRDAAWFSAAQVEAVERAKRLDDGLEVLPRGLLFPHYQSVVDEALALDPEDSLGLRHKFDLLSDPAKLQLARKELEQIANSRAEAEDWAGLETAMGEAAKRHSALRELCQFALLFQAVGQLEQGQLEGGLTTLNAAKARDPRGAMVGRIDAMIVAVRKEQGEQDF